MKNDVDVLFRTAAKELRCATKAQHVIQIINLHVGPPIMTSG